MSQQVSSFNIGPVTKRSMPFWCIGYPGGDPFGGSVLKPLNSAAIATIIRRAAGNGWIELTSAHDDDLVPWNPDKPEDDLDTNGEVHETLLKVKGILDEAGVGVNMLTCSLHSNALFRDGGLTNPNPKIRDLARLKVQRTLRIGNMLSAKYFTYWVARDGFEVAVKVPWVDVISLIINGLNGVTQYIDTNGLDNYVGATIEPKPNEPRGHMFVPTAGHAQGIIAQLEKPAFWGVNPELIQHEGMTLLDPLTCIANLVNAGQLSFLHFGNQIKGQFDNDFPPLVGPEHLKETSQMFWLLDLLGWKGIVEYDCHMLRCETDPEHQVQCKLDFIENCSTGLSIALQLATRLKKVDVTGLSHTKADLKAIMAMCGLDEGDVQKLTTKAPPRT